MYVNATRSRFREVIKNATNLSQHEALKGAHVHETSLCVTFGALRFGTHFRLLTRCSNYAVIHITLGTHVPQTKLYVTFGARPRSIPLSLLDRLFGHLGRQGRPRTPERFRRATVWVGLPTSPRDALQTLLRHARGYIETSRRVSFVGESAMHMKWPDDIGREAGNGRTRNGKELSVFRACPWRLALRRVTPRWTKRVGPSENYCC